MQNEGVQAQVRRGETSEADAQIACRSSVHSIDAIIRHSVLAAGVENRQNHEVRIGVAPPLGLGADRLGRIGCVVDEAQMPAARHCPEMFDADAGEPGNLVLGEDLLARSNGNSAHDLLHLLQRSNTMEF